MVQRRRRRLFHAGCWSLALLSVSTAAQQSNLDQPNKINENTHSTPSLDEDKTTHIVVVDEAELSAEESISDDGRGDDTSQVDELELPEPENEEQRQLAEKSAPDDSGAVERGEVKSLDSASSVVELVENGEAAKTTPPAQEEPLTSTDSEDNQAENEDESSAFSEVATVTEEMPSSEDSTDAEVESSADQTEQQQGTVSDSNEETAAFDSQEVRSSEASGRQLKDIPEPPASEELQTEDNVVEEAVVAEEAKEARREVTDASTMETADSAPVESIETDSSDPVAWSAVDEETETGDVVPANPIESELSTPVASSVADEGSTPNDRTTHGDILGDDIEVGTSSDAATATLDEAVAQRRDDRIIDSQGHFGAWGVHRVDRKYANFSVLELLFQNLFHEEESALEKAQARFKAGLNVSIPTLEELRSRPKLILDGAELNETASTPLPISTKPTNGQFVDGLDDFDEIFEGVDPPDELDVGGDGSSIQEVLMGTVARIVIKRITMSAQAVRRGFVVVKNDVTRRVQVVRQQESVVAVKEDLVRRFHSLKRRIQEEEIPFDEIKEKIRETATKAWLATWHMCREAFEAGQEFFESFFEGDELDVNLGGIDLKKPPRLPQEPPEQKEGSGDFQELLRRQQARAAG